MSICSALTMVGRGRLDRRTTCIATWQRWRSALFVGGLALKIALHLRHRRHGGSVRKAAGTETACSNEVAPECLLTTVTR